MLLLPTAPQDERMLSIISHNWREKFVVFFEDKLPTVLVILAVIFVFQRLVRYSVKRLHRRADSQVGNFHRAAQLRTMASILRATAYGVLGFIAFLQILN